MIERDVEHPLLREVLEARQHLKTAISAADLLLRYGSSRMDRMSKLRCFWRFDNVGILCWSGLVEERDAHLSWLNCVHGS